MASRYMLADTFLNQHLRYPATGPSSSMPRQGAQAVPEPRTESQGRCVTPKADPCKRQKSCLIESQLQFDVSYLTKKEHDQHVQCRAHYDVSDAAICIPRLHKAPQFGMAMVEACRACAPVIARAFACAWSDRGLSSLPMTSEVELHALDALHIIVTNAVELQIMLPGRNINGIALYRYDHLSY